MKWLLCYLAGMSLLAFLLCGIDKGKARKGRWRIPEKTLFLVSGLGGAWGFLLGMFCFHHKTRRWSFRILIPLFSLLWLAACALLLWKGLPF